MIVGESIGYRLSERLASTLKVPVFFSIILAACAQMASKLSFSISMAGLTECTPNTRLTRRIASS